MRAILTGFRRLMDFKGRDRRSQFWPYALTVVGLSFVGLWLGMIPTMNAVFEQASTLAATNPEAATVVSSPGRYSVEIHDASFMPDMGPFFAVVRIGAAVTVILLAAAVTRRLHDVGRPGYWALPPAVFLMISLTAFPVVMTRFMAQEAPDIGLFMLLFLNNLLYMASLIGLIILLVLDSKKTPNRYGAPPTRSQPASFN
nr:DUF805 domain-containing protein [uncultured Brevundimonas sp.]